MRGGGSEWNGAVGRVLGVQVVRVSAVVCGVCHGVSVCVMWCHGLWVVVVSDF